MKKISAILLAAGESKRMGVNKLALPWGRKTVLEHCVDVLLRAKIMEVVVVLSDRSKALGDRLRGPKVKLVMNPNYHRGISTSIRRGVQAVDRKSDGILIALGDHPLLRTKTINALVHALVQKKGKIIVPIFRGRRGHPVLISPTFAKELLHLKGDVGARSLLQKHLKSIFEVRTKSEGVVTDMDTWEDYRKVSQGET
jgi:molybdenum cofactor cytidylyltransferase